MDQQAKLSGSSRRKSNSHACNLHLKLWKSFPAGRLDQTGWRSDGAPGPLGVTLTLSIPVSLSPWPDLWSCSPAVLTPGCFMPCPLTSAQSCIRSITLASPSWSLLWTAAFHPLLVTLLYYVHLSNLYRNNCNLACLSPSWDSEILEGIDVFELSLNLLDTEVDLWHCKWSASVVLAWLFLFLRKTETHKKTQVW